MNSKDKPTINSRFRLIPVLLLAGIALFAVFVWPTRYRYDHTKMGEDNVPVRTDRLTGKGEFLSQYGWHEFPKLLSERESRVIPSEEVAKLTGQAEIESIGWIKVNLYNGSQWTASEITVLVTVHRAETAEEILKKYTAPAAGEINVSGLPILSRPYRLTPGHDYDDPRPQTNTEFLADLGFKLENGQTWEWKITAAKGWK